MLYHYSSSYLTPVTERPKLTPRQQQYLQGLLRIAIHKALSLPAKYVLGGLSWLFLIVGTSVALSPYTLPDPSAALRPASMSAASVIKVSAEQKAPVLPGGPTGQLMPPGAFADPYTYANSYSHGQCTWYVAGRRQVPSNWGNAVTWYARARAAGWSVGTTPAIGAIAWTPAGSYGHVALVLAVDGAQVQISEMNYLGPYLIDKRWVPATDFKYIY
jgi:surface antigen